jgi:hypothetical protein
MSKLDDVQAPALPAARYWKTRQSRATVHLLALARKYPLCANDHGPHDDNPDD